MLFGFGLLLVLSGFASLTFQVTWVRLIGLSIGGSSASVSVVVTAFFGGLSLGSWLAPRLLKRVAPLPAYLLLELGIGVAGLCSLPLLLRLDDWLALVPAVGSSLGFKFLIAVCVLIIPTACMGATFPTAVAVFQRSTLQPGRTYGELYALNTLGAVLGAALCGFVLVPRMGLNGAIWVASGVNFAIVVFGWALRQYWPLASELAPQPIDEPVRSSATDSPLSGVHVRALVVLAGTGFVSIAAEICWTKFLTMFVGTTLYGFSAVLATYLFGVALGAWLVRRHVDRHENPERALGIGLALLALAILLSCDGMNTLPRAQAWLDAHAFSPQVASAIRYAVVLLTLLPATLVLGALFPYSLRTFCSREGHQPDKVGLAYSVNTLAGIGASIGCGLYWIPAVGVSVILTSLAVLCLGLSLLFLPELGKGRVQKAARVLWGVGLLLALFQPKLQLEKLINSVRQDRFQLGDAQLRLLYLAEGKTGIISAGTADDQTAILYDSGLRESIVLIRDPDNGLFIESMLALYPYLLHPDPKTAFVVGFGGGATMRAFEFTNLQKIHVVELEPAMRDAVVSLTGAGPAGLLDPRLHFEVNDARNALLLDPQKYDLIASQPSHPWRSGAGTIFTREFFKLAASRLNPGGIYSQWVNLFRMDVPTLKAILRSFLDVYPEAFCLVHQGTSDLLLIGSMQPLRFERDRLQSRVAEPRVARFLGQWQAASVPSLLSLFGLSRAELLAATGPGQRSTDTNLLPEVRLGRAANFDDGGAVPIAFLTAHAGFDILPYLDSAEAAGWLGGLVKLLESSRPGIASRDQVEQRWKQLP